MTYWYIKKITGNQPTLSSGNTAWQVDIADRDSNDEAVYHYEFPTVVGPDFTDGLSVELNMLGYCPGEFGDCA